MPYGVKGERPNAWLGMQLNGTTGAGGNLLAHGARLAVPTTQRPELVAFGFASGFIGTTSAGPRRSAGTDRREHGQGSARDSDTETIVFELAAPYQWDVPILAWLHARADERGLGAASDFSHQPYRPCVSGGGP